jgi:hypothetical protein
MGPDRITVSGLNAIWFGPPELRLDIECGDRSFEAAVIRSDQGYDVRLEDKQSGFTTSNGPWADVPHAVLAALMEVPQLGDHKG